MKNNPILRVVEIFHSIQGEGANTGRSAVFIRLAGCNKQCDFCDTDFNSFSSLSVSEVATQVATYSCDTIIWTGGEPTLQLTEKILSHFTAYFNCIETNGSNPIPKGIDYISCSPKAPVSLLKKTLPEVDEIRIACDTHTVIPALSELPKAKHYFLSPIFEGDKENKNQFSRKNLNKCLREIHANNRWRLSVQLHKFLNIE